MGLLVTFLWAEICSPLYGLPPVIPLSPVKPVTVAAATPISDPIVMEIRFPRVFEASLVIDS